MVGIRNTVSKRGIPSGIRGEVFSPTLTPTAPVHHASVIQDDWRSYCRARRLRGLGRSRQALCSNARFRGHRRTPAIPQVSTTKNNAQNKETAGQILWPLLSSNAQPTSTQGASFNYHSLPQKGRASGSCKSVIDQSCILAPPEGRARNSRDP